MMFWVIGLAALALTGFVGWCMRGLSMPALNCSQRQTFALVSLFLGEVALTGLWIGLYAFEYMMHRELGVHSEISEEGQKILWRLMAIHAGAMSLIAIGDIVSARIGDWFEIKRGSNDETGKSD